MGIAVALATLALAAAAKSAPTSAFTYGHAAYTYGPLHCVSDPCSVVPSCNKAHWAEPIGAFNDDKSISDAMITQVYSYGGDVEFWPNKNNEQACWHLPTWPTATPPHTMTRTTRPQPLCTLESLVSSLSLPFLTPVWTAGT